MNTIDVERDPVLELLVAADTAIEQLDYDGRIFERLADRYEQEDRRSGRSLRAAAVQDLRGVAAQCFAAADGLRRAAHQEHQAEPERETT